MGRMADTLERIEIWLAEKFAAERGISVAEYYAEMGIPIPQTEKVEAEPVRPRQSSAHKSNAGKLRVIKGGIKEAPNHKTRYDILTDLGNQFMKKQRKEKGSHDGI